VYERRARVRLCEKRWLSIEQIYGVECNRVFRRMFILTPGEGVFEMTTLYIVLEMIQFI